MYPGTVKAPNSWMMNPETVMAPDYTWFTSPETVKAPIYTWFMNGVSWNSKGTHLCLIHEWHILKQWSHPFTPHSWYILKQWGTIFCLLHEWCILKQWWHPFMPDSWMRYPETVMAPIYAWFMNDLSWNSDGTHLCLIHEWCILKQWGTNFCLIHEWCILKQVTHLCLIHEWCILKQQRHPFNYWTRLFTAQQCELVIRGFLSAAWLCE